MNTYRVWFSDGIAVLQNADNDHEAQWEAEEKQTALTDR